MEARAVRLHSPLHVLRPSLRIISGRNECRLDLTNSNGIGKATHVECMDVLSDRHGLAASAQRTKRELEVRSILERHDRQSPR